MHWMIEPLRRYADFSGRSRRMEYWMWVLFNTVVTSILIGFIFAGMPWSEIMAREQATAAGMVYTGPEGAPGVSFYIGLALIGLWTLGTIVPNIAVAVRRLHDQDKSGWLYLISFIPFGGLVLFVFFLLDGTRGPNQYGPDPKGHDGAGTFS